MVNGGRGAPQSAIRDRENTVKRVFSALALPGTIDVNIIGGGKTYNFIINVKDDNQCVNIRAKETWPNQPFAEHGWIHKLCAHAIGYFRDDLRYTNREMFISLLYANRELMGGAQIDDIPLEGSDEFFSRFTYEHLLQWVAFCSDNRHSAPRYKLKLPYDKTGTDIWGMVGEVSDDEFMSRLSLWDRMGVYVSVCLRSIEENNRHVTRRNNRPHQPRDREETDTDDEMMETNQVEIGPVEQNNPPQEEVAMETNQTGVDASEEYEDLNDVDDVLEIAQRMNESETTTRKHPPFISDLYQKGWLQYWTAALEKIGTDEGRKFIEDIKEDESEDVAIDERITSEYLSKRPDVTDFICGPEFTLKHKVEDGSLLATETIQRGQCIGLSLGTVHSFLDNPDGKWIESKDPVCGAHKIVKEESEVWIQIDELFACMVGQTRYLTHDEHQPNVVFQIVKQTQDGRPHPTAHVALISTCDIPDGRPLCVNWNSVSPKRLVLGKEIFEYQGLTPYYMCIMHT